MKITTLDEASSLGERHFFTGLPCSRGHVSPRFVSSRGCVQCSAENRSSWRKKNPDKARDADKSFRDRNKEKVDAWTKSWRARNPEKVSKHNRDYYARTPGRAESNKLWRDKNKDKKRRYEVKRRMKLKFIREDDLSERKKTEDRWQKMFDKCHVLFEKTGHKWHVDHIIPLSKGGRHHYSNFQILPAILNVRKSSRAIYIEPFSWVKDWQDYLKGLEHG